MRIQRIIGFLITLVVAYFFAGLVIRSFSNWGIMRYFALARIFLFPDIRQVDQAGGRTNILILGKSGPGNDSPDLTDTIIFSSVTLGKPAVTLISVPRDIWVPSIRAKLNSAYYWGGLFMAEEKVQEIIGQPVHYGVVIDFSAFTKIIDALGEIEVDVKTAFIDEKYPIAGRENDLCDGDRALKCRYETIGFSVGKQQMDGAAALKFVRSRHAVGDEGTDLAREARQQLVIEGIKEKLLSRQFIFSPRKILAVYNIARTSVETDMGDRILATMARKILMARDNVRSFAFPQELIFNPPKSAKYDRQYVFVPKSGSWEQVWAWVKTL